MRYKVFLAVIVTVSLATVFVQGNAAGRHAVHQEIKLSPDVLRLLRAEMAEIAAGIQGLALSLATADWASVKEISGKIQTSYIMKKKLTAAQAQELKRALPENFKRLDAEFHQRAGKLGVAAAARDPELAAFHYSRLLESCALCHSAYARSRFPGFSASARQEHSH